MFIAYPFQINSFGCTATVKDDLYIKQMLEQLLFTSPGERVNRPNFGSGVMQMVFDANPNEVLIANQLLVQGALQQWLGTAFIVEAIDVQREDAILKVTVQYYVQKTQQRASQQFNYSF